MSDLSLLEYERFFRAYHRSALQYKERQENLRSDGLYVLTVKNFRQRLGS